MHENFLSASNEAYLMYLLFYYLHKEFLEPYTSNKPNPPLNIYTLKIYWQRIYISFVGCKTVTTLMTLFFYYLKIISNHTLVLLNWLSKPLLPVYSKVCVID